MPALADLYLERRSGTYRGHADMVPHMARLADLAASCDHCTEFGIRTGTSTIALLEGLSTTGGGTLVSYDLNPPSLTIEELPAHTHWHPIQANTARLATIDPTDLLLIDTLHTAAQVEAELHHARRVTRYLVFHDVVKFGWHGEADESGILTAIFAFLARHPEWRVLYLDPSPWGLLTLHRS